MSNKFFYYILLNYCVFSTKFRYGISLFRRISSIWMSSAI